MGSVIVSWKGSCADRARQAELCERIEPIALLSESYYEDEQPIVRYDQVLEGTVLISRNVFQQAPTTLPVVIEPADEPLPTVQLRVSGSREPERPRLTEAFCLPAVTVHGTAFRLYTWSYYTYENQISLAFASSHDFPELAGQLVEVHDRVECQTSENEVIRQADWYLTVPSIHLRYCGELWIDVFLGVIKHFLVPNLEYRRYEELPGYRELVELLGRDRPGLVDGAFAALEDLYQREVNQGSTSAAAVRDFWDAASACLSSRIGPRPSGG